MSGMFYNCYEFNQPLNKWDVSNVMILDEMFSNCKSFDQDISKWNTNNTYTAYNMFSYCPIEYKNKPKFN
jgi:surface protein